MKPQPVTSPTFGNRIYQYTKATSYGKCIHGQSRGFDYDAYVATDERTGNVEHKLYCVFKDNKFIKSVLKFFSGNKVYKELRGQGK